MGVVILNPSFADYANYFGQTSKQLISSSHFRNSFRLPLINSFVYALCFVLARIIHRSGCRQKWITTTYLDWSEHFDLDNDRTLAQPGLHLVQGWEFDAKQLLSAHRDYIVDFFKPAEALREQIFQFREKLKGKSPIVGVHIRHGDYQNFLNGKYFYAVEDYLLQMRKVLRTEPDAHFLVCTNNMSLSEAGFGNISVSFAPGHELLDLYLLASCDYIMGPPSTYSLWASFYGRVPLYQIVNLNDELDLSHFRIYG